jgi:hypothetical protein
MSPHWPWLAALATMAVLAAYEAVLALTRRRHPERLARSAHAALREEWFTALSAQEGSELLAVQTLRNAMMSATVTASTAVLALMGSMTLAAPSLHAGFGDTPGTSASGTRLALELVLMALLFASAWCSAMALRYYHHASFIVAMRVGSAARQRRSDAGLACVRRAGELYSWGWRYLVLVVPVLASILEPAAGPAAALAVAATLFHFDHIGLDQIAKENSSG